MEIPPRVLAALRESDRKMKYMEYDLKAERPVKDETGAVIALLPGQEDSLERLMETDRQFAVTAPSPEEIVLESMEVEALRRYVALLDKKERMLIRALLVDRLTEREYGKRIGVTQQCVSKRLQAILKKMRRQLKSFGCELPNSTA
jgi:RNA polymerase sigma factor (sigma-70 family)